MDKIEQKLVMNKKRVKAYQKIMKSFKNIRILMKPLYGTFAANMWQKFIEYKNAFIECVNVSPSFYMRHFYNFGN